MTRPQWEVADVIRIAGSRFRQRYSKSLTWAQLKVIYAIALCRTAALGGHRDQCAQCGYQAISYNSCRNRHCPKCQTNAREKWLRTRQQELLPVGYFHLVFSVPHELIPLIWQNKKILFTLLFESSAATLLEVAADPKHLGADIGFLSILHTWGQTLQPHPHIHCVVPGGGLSPDHTCWISSRSHFFLPVKVLSRVFRGKFLAGLRCALRSKRLAFHGECWPLANEKTFCHLSVHSVPAGLGRLCQAAVWWARTRPALSRSLYPSRRHFQPSPSLGQRLPRDLSMEGLRASQQATCHDSEWGGVSAPLLTARLAQELSPHSLFRLARQPNACRTSSALPPSSRPATPGSRQRARTLAMHALPRADARGRTTHHFTDLLPANPMGALA